MGRGHAAGAFHSLTTDSSSSPPKNSSAHRLLDCGIDFILTEPDAVARVTGPCYRTRGRELVEGAGSVILGLEDSRGCNHLIATVVGDAVVNDRVH
jgi:hypothetical protein